MVNGGSELVPQRLVIVCWFRVYKKKARLGVLVQTVVPSAAEFQGPRILVHAPRYEWHLEVNVQGLGEEVR